jgi:hypothetical protein
MVASDASSPSTFGELIGACSSFYKDNLKKISTEHVRQTRSKLSGFARAFHEQCGTLTPSVKNSLEDLKSGHCVVLMTAHQPNFFPYSGVLRKATLNFLLGQKLEELLGVPVVNFFGIADQDFTDDPWVKSAILPDVERRDGILELRLDLPEKMIFNKIEKPSKTILDGWYEEIESWFRRELGSIQHSYKSLGIGFNKRIDLEKNFVDFWEIVEKAYARAETCSDFNAFVMSRIINEVWRYDTVFARFSECQQTFEREFCFLLSHFDKYSVAVKEVTERTGGSNGGVFEYEHATLPFWYHCDCGSKVRLTATFRAGSLVGEGECVRCKKQYQIDFGPKKEPLISEHLTRISARSISMPLVFFDGLGVCCYVGGMAGKQYLNQARHVSEKVKTTFPPVVVWRPKDVYFGLGQLRALLVFREISGTCDLSRSQLVAGTLEEEIAKVQKHVDELELQKKELAQDLSKNKKDMIDRMKALSLKQDQIRKDAHFSLVSRNLTLLRNVNAVMNLFPCIVDYAVNISLKATSEQWMAFLKENGSLTSSLSLRTNLDESLVGPFLNSAN